MDCKKLGSDMSFLQSCVFADKVENGRFRWNKRCTIYVKCLQPILLKGISMKKYISLILVLIFTASICACTYVAGFSHNPVPSEIADHIDSYVSLSAPLSKDNVIETIEEEIEEPESETEAPAEPEPAKVPRFPRYIKEPPVGVVYLTFDDGPGKYSDEVLAILDEYGISATFFLVGKFIKYYPEQAVRIAEAGHPIGCHSMNHEYRSLYSSADSIYSDIVEWESAITEAIGYTPDEKLYRFPGGSNNAVIDPELFPELHEAVNSLGYRCYDWNCANNDRSLGGIAEGQTVDDYLKQSSIWSLNIRSNRKIMLLHESSEQTVEMLPWLIEYIISLGYSFDTLDNYAAEFLFAG